MSNVSTTHWPADEVLGPSSPILNLRQAHSITIKSEDKDVGQGTSIRFGAGSGCLWVR